MRPRLVGRRGCYSTREAAEAARSLQCGRGLLAAEAVHDRTWRHDQRASMWPRLVGRGGVRAAWDSSRRLLASMEPQLVGHGGAMTRRRRSPRRNRFNGAAACWPRRPRSRIVPSLSPSSFNGAAACWPRRLRDGFLTLLRSGASMWPRLVDRGGHAARRCAGPARLGTSKGPRRVGRGTGHHLHARVFIAD